MLPRLAGWSCPRLPRMADPTAGRLPLAAAVPIAGLRRRTVTLCSATRNTRSALTPWARTRGRGFTVPPEARPHGWIPRCFAACWACAVIGSGAARGGARGCGAPDRCRRPVPARRAALPVLTGAHLGPAATTDPDGNSEPRHRTADPAGADPARANSFGTNSFGAGGCRAAAGLHGAGRAAAAGPDHDLVTAASGRCRWWRPNR